MDKETSDRAKEHARRNLFVDSQTDHRGRPDTRYSEKENGKIQVFENVLSDPLMQKECSDLLTRPKWSFNGGGGATRFWHMDGLDDDGFFAKAFFGIVKSLTLQNPDEQYYHVKRIYANGQTACQNGGLHIDDNAPNSWTFLYFATPDWYPQYEGDLVFIDNHRIPRQEIKVVQYLYNRGVLFPSQFVHVARAPARQYPGIRISVAYKLDLMKLEKVSIKQVPKS